MRTDVEVDNMPTEVLIPEARQHQKRRYVRIVVITALSALLVATIVAAAIAFFGHSANGTPQSNSPAPAVSREGGVVYFRPVLCYAPPYNPAQSVPATGSLSCDPANALTEQNLNIQPAGNQADGFTENPSPPDLTLARVPTTKPSADEPGATVLLPGVRGACDGSPIYRCLLGPSEISSASIKSASARRGQNGVWVVDYTMTSRGSVLWDTVTHASFHQVLGIELNGIVYSAPIIQPTQSSFSSFDGKGEISGNLKKADAIRLATAMQPHNR